MCFTLMIIMFTALRAKAWIVGIEPGFTGLSLENIIRIQAFSTTVVQINTTATSHDIVVASQVC